MLENLSITHFSLAVAAIIESTSDENGVILVFSCAGT